MPGSSLSKPTWMDADTWREFQTRHPVPWCAVCNSDRDPTVDHIVPRWQGGTDDLSNLQWLCRPCNSRKGPRSDHYWSQSFYWDGEHQLGAFRTAQREECYEKILHYAPWFTRPWSQISRRLYLLAWIVASGKTLAIPALAFSLNHIIRRDCPPGTPRVDRILVLAKDQAIRDQLARALREDIVEYRIAATPPSVGIVTEGSQLDTQNWVDQHDVIIGCIHQLFEKNGQPRKDMEKVLARFGLLVIDEQHYAWDQVLRIVEAAQTTLAFGLTGSPLTGAGRLLDRSVLFSLYDYDDATRYDNSLKFASDEEKQQKEMVEVVGIDEAELMREGETFNTDSTNEPGYAIALVPALSVAQRVVQYVWDCDCLCDGGQLAGSAQRQLAGHRPIGRAVPSLNYPVHAMIRAASIEEGQIICDHLNDLFERDRGKYRLDRGYRAALVCSSTEDQTGKARKVKPLTPEHPWLWSKRNGGALSAECVRFVVNIFIGREGVDNAYCGVVGLARSSDSLIEIIQALIGRQLRSVSREEQGSLFVPPARLDTIKIITHAGFRNQERIEEGLRFIAHMGDFLKGLATMEDLMAGWMPQGERPDEEGILTRRERIDIARLIGVWREAGQPIDPDWLMDEYGGDNDKRRKKIGGWIDAILQGPETAYEQLTGLPASVPGYLVPVTVVMREYPTTDPTNDDLIRFIETHQPTCAGFLNRLAELRTLFEAMYRDHADKFHIGEVRSPQTLEEVRRSIVTRIRGHIRGALESDPKFVHQYVGLAVKLILGVPRGESASNGSKWDVPQCRVILTKPQIEAKIAGFTLDRLIKKGHCPSLATAFGIAVEEEGDDDAI